MRLIDADALIEEVWHSGLGSRQDCVNLIQEMPTIERPHGEWKKDGFFAICSKCGHELQYYEYVASRLNFCPNCGADMRKEGDEK